MPKTILGKWSVGLCGSFILFLLLFYGVVAMGERGGDTFFSNPALVVPSMIAGIGGVAGFFVGLIAIIRQRERSWLVYISIIIGLFVIILVSGEFISPH